MKTTACPHCAIEVEYDTKHSGESVDCPACFQAFKLPENKTPPIAPIIPVAMPVRSLKKHKKMALFTRLMGGFICFIGFGLVFMGCLQNNLASAIYIASGWIVVGIAMLHSLLTKIMENTSD